MEMLKINISKLCLILALVMTAQFAIAQNSLKINTNFLYANSGQDPRHWDHGGERFSFLYDHLSFGYRKEKGLISHETELKLLIKSEGRDNHKVNQFQAQIAYEFGGALRTELFNFLRVRIGNQWKLFYLRENIDSREYNQFPVVNWNTGIRSGLFLHFEYDITDRIYVDLSTSFISATISVNSQRVSNPSLTERQQQTGGFDFDVGQERILRIGLGFKLGYMGGEDEEDEIQKEWDERQKKKGKKRKKKSKKKN